MAGAEEAARAPADMAGEQTPEAQLRHWFATGQWINVDIVGDYAGREPFLVHGESLLRHCFEEYKVDFEGGFQLLHAVYAVETFLQNLRQRGCIFNIIFLKNLRDLCVPSTASADNAFKYQLARSIIIRHLVKSAPAPAEDGARHDTFEFEAVDSPECQEYLLTQRLHFVFCHEGDDRREKDAVQLRHLIYKFAARGISVAKINQAVFKSSKIFAPIHHGAERSHKEWLISPSFDAPYTHGDAQLEASADLDELKLQSRKHLTSLVCEKINENSSSANDALCLKATLLHGKVLQESTLEQRQAWVAYDSSAVQPEDLKWLRTFSTYALDVVERIPLSACSFENESTVWDLYDLLDGRAYLGILEKLRSSAFDESSSLDTLYEELSASVAKESLGTASSSDLVKVLPFTHNIVSEFVPNAKWETEKEAESPETAVVFREIKYWNANRKVRQPKVLTAREEKRKARKHQRRMAAMTEAAASLSGSTGKVIKPEVIIVIKKTARAMTNVVSKGHAKNVKPDKPAANKAPPKTANVKSKQVKAVGGRAAATQAAADVQDRKALLKRDTVVSHWKSTCEMFEKNRHPVPLYFKVLRFFAERSREDLEALGSEVQLYLCKIIGKVWAQARVGQDPSSRNGLYLIAMLYKWLVDMTQQPSTIAVVDVAKKMCKHLEISGIDFVPGSHRQSLAFSMDPKVAPGASKLVTDYRDLQLEYGGPYMDRRFDPKADSRVPFDPDAWQRRVLDSIDEDNSMLVVAPTSAGKTFISFYAMKKTLQESDDSVLVYVAPTKALVNQVAAEVIARFSKSYDEKAGKSLWAIRTSDYSTNNPTQAQILVTVPQILQQMLLSPINSQGQNPWTKRVKRIIFDEVHSIGNAEDGHIWEQILLATPCPVIALSATVGNPSEFRDWIAASQAKSGRKMDMIVHEVRYSELRKFVHQPPRVLAFQGLQKVEQLPVPGLDEGHAKCDNFKFLHPVSVLTAKNEAALQSIALEARDCFTLWHALRSIVPAERLKALGLKDRVEKLPSVVTKSDVTVLEKDLRAALATAMVSDGAMIEKLRQRLEAKDTTVSTDGEPDQVPDHIKALFPLALDLHSQDALPALVFNHDPDTCEVAAQSLAASLEAAENKFKESSAAWKSKMARYEVWIKAKSGQRKMKITVSRSKDDGDGDAMSKLDAAREEGSTDASAFEGFDPEAPLAGYSFADQSKLLNSELDEYISSLHGVVPLAIVNAMRRGIAVHHASMNRYYRQVVETLFRKGFLRLVVATGTLALGINMPCKTTVFSGDSVWLTAQQYRQCSGRAGRRGYDLLGNVVFSGISRGRVYDIMSTRLPDLQGQYPLTTTLVLRLFSLLHRSDSSDFAVQTTKSLLSQSHLYLGGPEAQTAIKHHLRFSVEYLRRNKLLSQDGVPIGFSALVNRLNFMEHAAFALNSLLRSGYLSQLCRDFETRPDGVMDELVLVLSHLFGSIPVKRTAELEKRAEKSSSSIFLPRLPSTAEKVLSQHNRDTLGIFKGYAKSFVTQNLAESPNDTLPFSKTQVGGKTSSAKAPSTGATIRSPFVALSGYDDEFKTIHDLCSTVRNDVFLDESTVPYVPIFPHDTAVENNAYLLDFWRNENWDALVKDNGIRRGQVWYVLNDFDRVLDTIALSLENMVYRMADPDADIEDIKGDYDDEAGQGDSALEEQAAEDEPAMEVRVAAAAPVVQLKTKKTKVVDSWDDDDDESDDGVEAEEAESSEDDEPSLVAGGEGSGILAMMKAFVRLRADFREKFEKHFA